MADKAELRRRMERVRAELPGSLREEAANAVCAMAAERLATLRERKGGPLVLLGYLPFRGELDVRPLLAECRRRGDVVLAPRIEKQTRRMRLLRMESAEDEVPGTWGIPEPKEGLAEWPESRLGEIDVVLVPGLAFDRKGGRIGYGGGFYDRMMQRFEAVRAKPGLWALAFDEQAVGEVPMEPHDFRVELLIVPDDMTNTTGRA
ncbi:5-formyltetrahydrofolate cyclo-ligase [Saccharibacillus alkalitolerans]|uniref:5-formyltetrahydrofolate cyclo-ligase n=1 Tax=Saccharibacillus alkalitolerans TaxID=2705290 RepID=A0ABX0F2X2_9BACL|nr:5-formyltetrahydrofolate cyclo-ligase [Saccharibacillus alkalitolerans]NGZ74825.1 5-formyltetrahydrofolate cyclo-ligase [Saccharibacillus alkalitolerans]